MPSRRVKSSAINERISQAQKERTPLACTLCRSRRIKCDGRLGTCSRCLADRRSDCRYENVGSAERIAGRQRKRALRKQHDDEDPSIIVAPTTNGSLLSSSFKSPKMPIITREALSPVSSCISTTSSLTEDAPTMPPFIQPQLHMQQDETPQRKLDATFNQHQHRHLLDQHHHQTLNLNLDTNHYNNTSIQPKKQGSDPEGEEAEENWSPLLLSSSSFSPPITSTEDQSLFNGIHDNLHFNSLTSTTKDQRLFKNDEQSDNRINSSSSTTNTTLPTSWNGSKLQHQSNSFYKLHPNQQVQQQQHQNDLAHQLFNNQQAMPQLNRNGMATHGIIPPEYLGNPDLDLTSVDALWRIYDWQYRCKNTDGSYTNPSSNEQQQQQQQSFQPPIVSMNDEVKRSMNQKTATLK